MKSFVAKNFNVEGAQFDAQVIAAPCPACLVIVLTLWLSLC
jgi:predicted transporter